jgi:hypothetical protein
MTLTPADRTRLADIADDIRSTDRLVASTGSARENEAWIADAEFLSELAERPDAEALAIGRAVQALMHAGLIEPKIITPFAGNAQWEVGWYEPEHACRKSWFGDTLAAAVAAALGARMKGWES